MADGDFIPDVGPPPKQTHAPAQEQPQATPDDFIPDTAPGERRVLENAPDDSFLSGTAKNAATGLMKGVSWVAGIPGDLDHLAGLGLAGIRSVFNGKTTSENMAEQEERRAAFNKAKRESLGPILGADMAAPTSEDVEKTITAPTGEYVPQTKLGKIGQTAIAGGVAALTPGGMRKMATEAALGATSAVAGEEAGNALGPGAGIAASVIAPKLATKVGKTALEPIHNMTAKRQLPQPTTAAPPPGNPAKISEALQDQIDGIMMGHENQVAQIGQRAQAAMSSAPQGGDLQSLYANQQRLAWEEGQRTRQKLNALRDQIDPRGDMVVGTKQVKNYASELQPKLADRVEANAAAPYIEKAAQFGETIPFGRLWDFDTELSGAIAKADRAGDQNGLRELRALKSSVKETIAKATDNQHELEQLAVQRGDLRQEDTLAARLQRQSATGTAGPVQRPGPVVRGNGTGGAGAPAPEVHAGSGQGAPGGSGAAPNFDPTAAAALEKFNKGYGQYKSTYRSGPVGQGVERKAFGNAFEDPLGGQTSFSPGLKGGANTRAWLEANNTPEAIENLKQIAAQELRQSIKPGQELTQATLDAWKRKFGPALNEIEQVSPGFTAAFDRAASAGEALGTAMRARDNFAKSATQGQAAKLMGLTNADDMTNEIGKIINARDSGRQIQDLKAKIGNYPGAWEGVQRAAADHVMNNLLPNNKLRDFLGNNPTAIQEIFGPGADQVLSRMAENESNIAKIARHAGETHDVGLFALWEALTHDPVHGAAIFAGNAAWQKARSLFAQWQQQGLTSARAVYERALVDPQFRQEFMKQAVQLKGGQRINGTDLLGLGQYDWSRLQGVNAGLSGAQEGSDERKRGYADGGAVDHKANGKRAVQEALNVRKLMQQRTKPLLQVHDNAIAHALAVAREANG